MGLNPFDIRAVDQRIEAALKAVNGKVLIPLISGQSIRGRPAHQGP